MPSKISDVCVNWQSDCPFFAEFLLRFTYIEVQVAECDTIGVSVSNNKIILIYNKDFLENLTFAETESICVHEIMHILNQFARRVGTRDWKIFNLAQDICINETVEDTTIKDRRLQLPKEAARFRDILAMGFKGDHISEVVYDFLEKRAIKITISSIGSNGKQCPDCEKNNGGGEGSGKDSKNKKNGDGEGDGKVSKNKKNAGGASDHCPTCGKKILRTLDDHSKHKDLTEIEKAAVEEIINNARTRSWGNLSGNMQSTIKQLIAIESIPWQQKLAMFMSRYVNEPGQIYENTWCRKNRRGLPLPGIRKLTKKIIVSVDTSGSVADEDLEIFFSQIEKIVKDFSSMTLIQWDTKVTDCQIYKRGDWKKIKVKGRGGTDVQDLYNYIHDKLKHVSLVVNFTDGYFDWNLNHYNIPTIWAIINNDNLNVPFGNVVKVSKKNKRSSSDG